MQKLNKLIRDNILLKLDRKSIKYKYHIANSQEYEKLLNKKLIEECKEFLENNCIEEIADILEVLEAICKHKGYKRSEIKLYKKNKKITNGAFKKRIILEYTE